MATLYDLQGEYLDLLLLAEDPDVDPQLIVDTMEALDGEIEEKADGYAMVMRDLEEQELALKNEIDRLALRKAAVYNNRQTMKKALEAAMRVTGKTKFKTTLFSFNIQRNPASVVVDVPWTKLPEDYLKYKDPEIDKTKLKKALQDGAEIEGAHLVQTESLRIK